MILFIIARGGLSLAVVAWSISQWVGIITSVTVENCSAQVVVCSKGVATAAGTAAVATPGSPGSSTGRRRRSQLGVRASQPGHRTVCLHSPDSWSQLPDRRFRSSHQYPSLVHHSRLRTSTWRSGLSTASVRRRSPATAFYADVWPQRTVFSRSFVAPTSQHRSRQKVNCSKSESQSLASAMLNLPHRTTHVPNVCLCTRIYVRMSEITLPRSMSRRFRPGTSSMVLSSPSKCRTVACRSVT